MQAGLKRAASVVAATALVVLGACDSGRRETTGPPELESCRAFSNASLDRRSAALSPRVDLSAKQTRSLARSMTITCIAVDASVGGSAKVDDTFVRDALDLARSLGEIAGRPRGAKGSATKLPGYSAPPSPIEGAEGFALKPLARFIRPVYVTSAPEDGNRLFVVEQGGKIWTIDGGRKSREPFLDVSADTATEGPEQGMLSVALAPDYATSGKLYVYHANRAGDIRLEEFVASKEDPGRADPSSKRVVLALEHPASGPKPENGEDHRVHYGGQLQFGRDGLLYVSIGDGGGQNDPRGRGQELSDLFGNVLRIDPRPSGGRPYTVPPDNPFVGRLGVRPEIFVYGLRNPYRFAFDPSSDALIVGDVGQYRFEEIDISRRGGENFGWKCYEGPRRAGRCTAPDHVPPALTLGRPRGCAAVIAGYVVRDPSIKALHDRYVYSDFCDPRLRSALISDGRAVDERTHPLRVPWISSFGEDASGRLYLTSLFTGVVYRVTADKANAESTPR